MTKTLIVLPCYDFRARRFRDRAFRTERGARAALARSNRIRTELEISPHNIWWRDGKPEEVKP